jgi:peptidoglycan/xylan/chitin deacetylase (PgdA/CDA1 family)
MAKPRSSPASRRAFLSAAAAATLAACSHQGTPVDSAGSPSTSTDRLTSGGRPQGSGTGSQTGTGANSHPATPKGPARAVFNGPRTGTQVALTFHGSGDPGLVDQLLSVVERAGAKITVFAVGTWLQQNPQMASRILGAGHELDNHTLTHPVLGRLGVPQVAREIRGCQAILKQLGAGPGGGHYFRPSGMTTPTPLVLAQAGTAGYPLVVAFDVDPRDYTDPGATAVAERVAAGVRPGSIVSLHTGHAGTVAAMRDILTTLDNRGLEPVPLRRLLVGEPSA